MASQGGRRRGMPGKAYPQRTDLMAQPVRTATGQPYGMAGQQAAAQKAIPLPQAPPVGSGMAGQPGPPGPGGPMPMPGPPPLPTPLDPHAPSARPNEHVMTGVARGPGMGPEAIVPPPVNMGPPTGNADVLATLQALGAANPTPGMLELLRTIKAGSYQQGGLYGKPLGAP